VCLAAGLLVRFWADVKAVAVNIKHTSKIFFSFFKT